LASGKVLHRSPLNQEWSGLYTVPYQKEPASTFYQRHFELMPSLLTAIFVGLLIVGIFSRKE
jgi:apolipoprotein N-acyltransferase